MTTLRLLISTREKLSTRPTANIPDSLTKSVEDSLEFAEECISTFINLTNTQERNILNLDNFIDYLVDKLDGDRDELMKDFLHGEEEW